MKHIAHILEQGLPEKTCYSKRLKERTTEVKICPECGLEFPVVKVGNRATKTYCSKECKKRNWDKNNQGYWKNRGKVDE